MKSQVAIIMGSDSDLPVMQDAAMVLDQFRISYELTIVSAHRTPDRGKRYIKKAELLAIQILSSKKPSFSKKIKKFKKSMNKEVLKKASKLEKIKYKKYLKG